MAAVLSVIVLGDESGYEMGTENQLAAIEAEWETQPPAAFTLFGIPIRKRNEQICDPDPLRAGHHCNAFRGYSSIGLKELMVQRRTHS